MKSLILIAAVQVFAMAAHAKMTMECKVSDKKSSVLLTPPSESETYMNEGRFKDLNINTMENGGGDSYTVTVRKGEEALVIVTVPFYEDADLKFKHNGQLITVICQK